MFDSKRIGVFASRQFVHATGVTVNWLGPTCDTARRLGSSVIVSVCAAMALSAVVFSPSGSQASFFGLPRPFKYQHSHIGFDTPVLPPIGHTRFCLKYPDDCTVHTIDFRRRNVALTAERWNELNEINRRVNRDIIAQVTPGNGVTEEWVVAPPAGDCKDYAITKRHELLGQGWPSRALLLSEVVVPSGEHHLILVVRTRDGDVVLDNLNANIRLVASIAHQDQWVRIETPQNPRFWARLPATVHTVMIADKRGDS